jgi:hypothetical protein
LIERFRPEKTRAKHTTWNVKAQRRTLVARSDSNSGCP